VTLLINGRFLTQPLTGVQRFARHLVLALDDILGDYPATLVTPRRTHWRQAELPLRHIQLEEWGTRSGHLWEQMELGWQVGDRPLLNLGNTAPLYHRRQWVVIHDAMVFAMPQTHRWYFQATYRRIYRRLGQICPHIFTVSEFSRRELQRYLALPQERLAVIPNAANHCQHWAGAQVPIPRFLDHQPFVLAIAHPAPHKNFGAIAQSLALLPPVHLVTIGTWDAKLYQSSAAPTPTHLSLGSVDDATLAALFARALAFVYPSRYEGFGLPPLEAMACGCPVIVGDIPALRETCGTAALYVSPDRPDELVAAIHHLHQNPALRQSLIAAGQAQAARFSWQRSAEVLWQTLALG
jgi:glycosyltransferase involved in cell wall biosynthesis